MTASNRSYATFTGIPRCWRCGVGVNFMRIPDVNALPFAVPLQCDTCFKRFGKLLAEAWKGVGR